MRIAITGMSGSLGRVLFEELSAENHDIIGLTRSAQAKGGIWWQETYGSPRKTQDWLSGCDVVIHCAGGGLGGSRDKIFTANADTTRYLINAINDAEAPKTFILISSIAAGGPADFVKRPRNVDDPPKPVSYYGASKLAAERSLAQLKPLHTSICLRLPTCHGAYEYRFRELLRYLKHGLMILPPAMRLSHIHVRDVAETISRLLAAPQSFAQTWNLCAPDSFCWTDLPAVVERLLQRPIRSFSAPRFLTGKPLVGLLDTVEKIGLPPLRYTDKLRDAQFYDWRADGSQLHQALNYIPRRRLADGLKEMIEL